MTDTFLTPKSLTDCFETKPAKLSPPRPNPKDLEKPRSTTSSATGFFRASAIGASRFRSFTSPSKTSKKLRTSPTSPKLPTRVSPTFSSAIRFRAKTATERSVRGAEKSANSLSAEKSSRKSTTDSIPKSSVITGFRSNFRRSKSTNPPETGNRRSRRSILSST